MPSLSPPPPVNQDVDSRQYKDWFYSIYALLAAPGSTLGTMAYQNYDNVNITGGQISNVGLTSVRANGLSGYLKGNGSASPITASTTIPMADVVTGYGSFQNTADQTFATANTATKIVLNTTDFIRGMTRSGSTITDITSGIYNVQFSLQMANTGTSIQEIELWLRKNGSDIAGTATKFSITSSHGGVDGYVVPVANFFVQLSTTDTLELWGAVTSTNLYIEAYAAQTSPYARPSIPSTVLTLSQVA